MSADDRLVPDLETLHSIVGDVFVGLLGDGPHPAAPAGPSLPVIATVSVSGAWAGEVRFACSATLARRVAATLFGVASERIGDDDLRDVAGELANVIGGNVKSVMPGPSVLSLPTASLDGEPGAAAATTSPSTRLDLAWDDEPLRVCVTAAG